MCAIPGFSGYAARKDGSIWSCRKFGGRSGFMAEWLRRPEYSDKDGYLWIAMYKNGKSKRWKVAHLILETFAGERPPGAHSLHYPDRDVRNNRIENLRWGTLQDNSDDKIKMGTQPRGTSNGMAKLTEEMVLTILATKNDSGVKLAHDYKVTPSLISAIRKRKIWKYLDSSGIHADEIKKTEQ
jgi:hypothetical protein